MSCAPEFWRSRNCNLVRSRKGLGDSATQLRVFNRFRLQSWVRLYIWTEGTLRQGLQNSAQGFKAGDLKINGSP